MERTVTYYRVRDYGVTLPSSYYADCQFFGKEIVMAIASRIWLWDLIFVMQPSVTLVLAAVHFGNCTHLNAYHFTVDMPGCGFRWHEVIFEKICAIAVKIQLQIHEDRQGLTSNGRVPGPFSISCYVMPIRVILLMMDAFGAGCCSRKQANVALLTLSILLLV